MESLSIIVTNFNFSQALLPNIGWNCPLSTINPRIVQSSVFLLTVNIIYLTTGYLPFPYTSISLTGDVPMFIILLSPVNLIYVFFGITLHVTPDSIK